MIETGFDLVTQGGRPPVIPLKSKGKIAVIHRAMKKQLWIKGSMDLLNQVLKRKEKETVSISAVRGAVGQMGSQLVPKGSNGKAPATSRSLGHALSMGPPSSS